MNSHIPHKPFSTGTSLPSRYSGHMRSAGTVDTSTSQADLGALIVGTYEKSQFPTNELRRDFSPRFALDRVITEALVKEAFGIALRPNSQDQELVEFTLRDAKKLFAISIVSSLKYNDLKNAINMFHDVKVTDRSLPIPQGLLQSYPALWDAARTTTFLQRQWEFIDTVFSDLQDSKIEMKMFQSAIFPFLEAFKINEGGFGTVYRATVHHSHILTRRPGDHVR